MAKIGVLLIQLGTPDEPTPSAVRRYLREFLGDPRVVETPRWLWWIILNFRILPRRSKESAEKYRRIWNPQTGSPLLHITRLQAAALERTLPPQFVVRYAMRYGNPSIDRAVNDFALSGVHRIVVLPMYPQYSAASTGTACDHLFQSLKRQRHMPAIRVIPPYYAHPAYIRALGAVARDETNRLDRPPDKFIFSFHGYPVDFVRKGDPYQAHVAATSRLLADELKLTDDQWLITYQSRFRSQIWLEPYTEETLCDLARQGLRRIFILAPGFTADCLETIDELGREAAESFVQAGGESLIRCPCLNDHPAWIDAMRQIVLEESAGWFSESTAGAGQEHPSDDSTILDLDLNVSRPQ